MIDPLQKLIEVWHRVADRFERLDLYGTGEVFTSPLMGEVDVSTIFGN